VTVHTACTGYEIISIVAVFILAYPASIRNRALGLGGTVLLMSFVNLARIVSIYWISTYYPALMTVAHEEIWPVLLNLAAVAALGCWFFWLKKDEKTTPPLAT
jgi:exosortase/archaeosortase family protein